MRKIPVYRYPRPSSLVLLSVGIVVWLGVFLFARWFLVAHGGHALVWDAAWYGEIARNGYVFNGHPNQQQVVAFLPLFPILVGAIAKSGIGIELSMLITPVLCSVLGVVLIYKAIASLATESESLAIVLLFMASPFSVYFLNGYSESLYLLLLGCFLYALLCKESPVAAAVFAGMATAVRPHALVLYFVYAIWELRRGRDLGQDAWARFSKLILLGPVFLSGILLTSLYFYFAFDDLVLYNNIMTAWGFDPLSDGIGAFIDHLRVQSRFLLSFEIDAWKNGFPPEFAKMQLWSFVLLLAFSWRRVPAVLGIYGLLLCVFALVVTEGSVNLGRHMATNLALPAAIVFCLSKVRLNSTEVENDCKKSGLGTSRWMIIALLCLIGMTVQSLFLYRFFNSQWVS